MYSRWAERDAAKIQQPRRQSYATAALSDIAVLTATGLLSRCESAQKYLKTRAQLSLGLADRTHGAHSQPASVTVRV